MKWFYQLPAPVILEVTGKDSPRYLNSRLTNDLRNMKVGEARPAAAITAQGKTEAFFYVLLVADLTYLLLADGGDRSAIKDALAKFIVADRVTVTDRSSDFAVIHIANQESHLSENALPPVPEVRCISRRRSSFGGLDLIVSNSSLEPLKAALLRSEYDLVSSAEAAWQQAQGAIPAFPEDILGTFFPETQISEALSFTKGCYVGQEVLEKLDARGKLSKALAFYKSDTPLSPGAELSSDSGEVIGTVVRWIPEPAGSGGIALGKVRLTSKGDLPLLLSASSQQLQLVSRATER